MKLKVGKKIKEFLLNFGKIYIINSYTIIVSNCNVPMELNVVVRCLCCLYEFNNKMFN